MFLHIFNLAWRLSPGYIKLSFDWAIGKVCTHIVSTFSTYCCGWKIGPDAELNVDICVVKFHAMLRTRLKLRGLMLSDKRANHTNINLESFNRELRWVTL